MNGTDGSRVSRVRYYPYGQIWTQEGTTPAPTDRLFTGYRAMWLRQHGIDYANSRFYSADLARFLSPDSIMPDASNPQALNRYSYVLNNPLTYTDPSGHCVYDMEGYRGCGLDPWTSGAPAVPRVNHEATPAEIYEYLVQHGVDPAQALCTVRSPTGCQPPQPPAAVNSGSQCVFDRSGSFCNTGHPVCTIDNSSACRVTDTRHGPFDDPAQLAATVAKAAWEAATSPCAEAFAGSAVVGMSIFAAATGAGALVEAGGVALASASAAATSATAIYYAAGPENVNRVLSYGPAAMSRWQDCVR